MSIEHNNLVKNLATNQRYTWNGFRYVGDFLHLFGVIAFFVAVYRNKKMTGFSKKTQILYLIVFCTRYLDLFDRINLSSAAWWYLTFFKLTYLGTSVLALSFYYTKPGYEPLKDSMALVPIFSLCGLLALILTDHYAITEILWTLSEFLEGFAMVPQYVFSYRDEANEDVYVPSYICFIGSYRVFYALNWIYKKLYVRRYSDYQSWIGGCFEIVFFLDFLFYRILKVSFLRTAVLSVDDKVNDMEEIIEAKILGKEPEIQGNLRRRHVAPADAQVMGESEHLV